MPKKPQSGKPSRSRSRGASGREDPLLDIIKTLDEDTLARVREALRDQIDFLGVEDDALALFDELLRRIADAPAPTSSEDEDFFGELVAALTQLSIDENGGDPKARGDRKLIYERLDEKIAEGGLDAANLVLVAKILSDSGWSVPDRLKSRLVELLDAGAPPEMGGSPVDLATALADIANATDGDAFAAYEAVNSVLAAFPPEAAARMVTTLGEGGVPVLLHALAGFAMHREPLLANAAIAELKSAAKTVPIDSALVERLVRMRPWLPADRQAPLDEAIRALRANAQPPLERERPSAAKCFVMACDGSGAAGVIASAKARDGWRFVAAMTKPSGVEDVLSMEGLAKRELDLTLRGMRESVMAAQTDVAGVARYLEIALGENIAAKKPPPFKLIDFVEKLGLGPIAPRPISSADLLAELLAEWPEAETDAAAVARALKCALGGTPEQLWFEAGEGVERLLAPVRGAKARVKAVLTGYLPQRREFWTRACARTAFALHLEPRAHGALARDLALVGRELASGAALEKIPLMRVIAETTVSAYESRGLD